MKVDTYYNGKNVASDSTFWQYEVYSQSFTEEGASNSSGVVNSGNFQHFHWLFLRKV